jgi:hypothetical protein
MARREVERCFDFEGRSDVPAYISGGWTAAREDAASNAVLQVWDDARYLHEPPLIPGQRRA